MRSRGFSPVLTQKHALNVFPAKIVLLWLNNARLAQGLSVTAPTVNRNMDLLADLVLLRRLALWCGNLGKRLVRSPNVYVRDSPLHVEFGRAGEKFPQSTVRISLIMELQ